MDKKQVAEELKRTIGVLNERLQDAHAAGLRVYLSGSVPSFKPDGTRVGPVVATVAIEEITTY